MATGGGGQDDRAQRGTDLLLAASGRLYGALLALYPRAFRERYAEEMRRDFADLSREGLEEGGRTELMRVWGGAFSDLALTAIQERGTAMARSAFLRAEPRVAVGALVAIVLVAATVAAASLVETPRYVASSTLLIGQDKSIRKGAPPEPLPLEGSQQLTQTLAEVTHSRPIAEETIERLGLSTTPDVFLERLEAEPIEATQFVELSYTDTDPQRARMGTNTVGEVLSRRVSEAGPTSNAVTAILWERALVPEEPVSPNPLRDGLLALVSGLLIFVGLAFALPRVAALRTIRAIDLIPPETQRVPAVSPATEAAKEKELLAALWRRGALTVAGVALETSLTVGEADRMLSALAAKGHLEVTVERGRLLYSLWDRDAPT